MSIKIGVGFGIPYAKTGISWSSYWTTRKRIPIAGAAGAGTNYQVMIEVNSGLGVDSAGVVYLNNLSLDFPNDLIFTSSDGTTKIPYWIDTVLGGATQKYVWVKPTADLSSGTSYIYLYYGNANPAYLSDGHSTFNFFENFDKKLTISTVANFTSLTELESLIEPNKYKSNPIISHGTGWKDSQLHYPCILVDPTDSTKLIMWIGGMAAPVVTGELSIGRYTGTVANPYSWTEYGSNPVLQKGAGGAWDDLGVIGPDTVLWNPDDSKYWMYYTGIKTATFIDAIGLATSSDGITWTKSASNPVLTADNGGRDDGTNVSGCSVIREGANWYMYYCYRDGATVLPGIRCASSADGITWTKNGAGDILSIGAWYDSTYIECVQALKIGTKYVLIYSCYNGVDWTDCVASSDSWNTGFTKSAENPLLTGSGITGAWDKKHIATTRLYNIANKWYAYYQASAASPYGSQNWDIGVATFDLNHYKILKATALNGQRGWTADTTHLVNRTYIKENSQSNKSISDVAYRNADNTVVITNTLGEVNLYIMDDTLSGAGFKYTATYYVMEGANIITGMGFMDNILQHLKAAAWEDVQIGCTAGTWYKVSIKFPTKSTHKVYVNDVEITGLATSNFTDITTAIDKVRIQRGDVTAGTAYFDLIKVQEYLPSPPVVGVAETAETGKYFPT